MTIYHLFVALAVLMAACAQMLLKKGASGNYSSIVFEYLNPWVISGYAIMFLSMIVDVWCISRGVQVKEVSIIESLSYLFVPLLSYFIFAEKITWRKAGAVVLIVCGIIVFFI